MKFIALVVILFPLLVQAQAFQIDKPPLPIDSLKKVLPSLRDSARVDCLNELARSYTEEETPKLFDSAWSLVRQAYAEASSINYVKGLGDACFRYGHLCQWWLFNSIEMEKYYREAISWHEKIKYDNGLGFGLWSLGNALLDKRAIDEANKTFERSAFYFRNTACLGAK